MTPLALSAMACRKTSRGCTSVPVRVPLLIAISRVTALRAATGDEVTVAAMGLDPTGAERVLAEVAKLA
jgi:hypothetical protein